MIEIVSEGLVGQKQIPGLLEQRAGDQTTYPLPDAHGDVTANTDQTGTVTARRSYDPWGTQTSGTPQSFGYLGAYMRRSDPTTGLVQMGARQYDPGLGRFTSEDQVLGYPTLGQSWNRHSYVFNRPLVMYDLDGRSACDLPIVESACEVVRNVGAGCNPLNPNIEGTCRPTKVLEEAGEEIREPLETHSYQAKQFVLGCVYGAAGGYAGGETATQVVSRLIRRVVTTRQIVVASCVAGGTLKATTDYDPPRSF